MVRVFNKIKMGLAIHHLVLKLPMKDIMSEDLALNMKWKMMNIIDKNKKIEYVKQIESLTCKIITTIHRANRVDKTVSQLNT